MLLAGCQNKQYDISIERDLEYATYQNQGKTKQLLLDLYLPIAKLSSVVQYFQAGVEGALYIQDEAGEPINFVFKPLSTADVAAVKRTNPWKNQFTANSIELINSQRVSTCSLLETKTREL